MKNISNMMANPSDSASFSRKFSSPYVISEGAVETTPNIGFCGNIFTVDYLSNSGKWLTFSKLLSLMFLPIVGGWTFTLYNLVDNITVRDETLEAQASILKAIDIGRLIYRIQKERDMTLLYISNIGPGTKAFLIQEYDRTDDAFSSLMVWPAEFAAHSQEEFRSKRKLISHINKQRNELDKSTTSPFDVLIFYSNMVDFFIEWMVESMKETGFGNIWKSLVVFHKITRCMLDTGAERAYGTIFFAQGNFPYIMFYELYFRRIHRFNYSYRSATYYSNLVDPLVHEQTEQKNVTVAIQKFRNIIKYSNLSVSYKSEENAQEYFDNVTHRVDFLFSLQELVASRVSRLINTTVGELVTNIVAYGFTVAIVILACPIMMYFSETLTSNIQTYSKVLDKASSELNQEKRKTDSLLYQMLPKLVVRSLKNGQKVESQYFKSATILFSSIVNFTQMSIEYTPLDLVDLLNILYTSLDQRIENYDIYKVETINDTYMVVSGVPNPNGMRHATEIANFALDVNNLIRQVAYTPKITIPMQLQLGASSGSVSAGVVGTATLRYCLFGDTVNIASRMKSYSMPSRIQVSEPLYKLLRNTGIYKLQPRGTVDIKGKGRMNTYWLLDSSAKLDNPEMPQRWTIPGEVESLDSSKPPTDDAFSQSVAKIKRGEMHEQCWG